jgi:hypothetical protein
MRHSAFTPHPRLVARLAATVMVVLTGCAEARENENVASGKLPEKSVLAEAAADLRALINKELSAGNKRIVVPPGRYRVRAERGSHLLFSNLADVEIIADNVELVCTSTVRALSFEDCSNVTLRGLAVDYDPLPFTQGRITAMATDKSWLEFEVTPGYPDNELKGPFQIYDPSTRSLRRGDGRWSDEVQSLGGKRYRVSKDHRHQFDPAEDTEQTGDILVARSAFGKGGSPHAIELRGCKGMRLIDITVFASPSFGFLERNCDGSTYLRCVVDRRAPEDDPVGRSVTRMRSLNADAFHSKDAPKGPSIIACTARFMGDDAVNINGRYHLVRGSKGREVRIAVIDQDTTIQVGDPVQFLPYSGPRPHDARVVRRQPDSQPFTAGEKAFIRRLRMDERMRTELLEGDVTFHTLTLDREVALAAGSAVCCPLRLGNGFAVKDCDFGHNRSRGILIKAGNGEVSGNRITNSRMHSILVSPEFWWMEAGMSSDLLIKDNIIKGCLQTPIQIHARGGNRGILPAGALRNISILDNRIEDSAWPLIHVTSTSGLVIRNNVLPAVPSGQARGENDKPAEPILLENCETTP